jgi:hypothetical protein
MKKNYYAVSYGMGVAVCANTGNRYAADYRSFPTRAARDEWVSEGGDYRSAPDWREVLLSSDCELKAALVNS